MEALKTEIDKLRKDKTRLERNLESKEEYINTLKSKSQKEEQEKDAQAREEKNAVILK